MLQTNVFQCIGVREIHVVVAQVTHHPGHLRCDQAQDANKKYVNPEHVQSMQPLILVSLATFRGAVSANLREGSRKTRNSASTQTRLKI